MKKTLLVLALIILSALLPVRTSLANNVFTPEIKLFNEIQKLGYERVYTDIGDDTVTIKLEINERDFIADLSKIFVQAYKYTDISNYKLELYEGNSRMFTISTTREAVDQYIGGRIGEEELLNHFYYEDQRSIEEKLKVDLEIFDTMVYGLKLDQNNCKIDLYYNGDDLNTFVSDLPNLHLLVIEHAPWVEKTTINIENHVKDECLQLTLKTENLIKLLGQEIDYEGYYDLAGISAKKTGSWVDGIMKVGSLADHIKKISAADIILLLVLTAGGLYGYMKGFISTLFSFLSYFLALIGSRLLAPKAARLLASNTTLTKTVSNFIKGKVVSFGTDPALMKLLSEQNSSIANHQNIPALLTYYVFSALSMVLIFILLKIFISYIGKLLDSRIKLTLAAKTNKVLGLVLGILTGLMISALCLLVAAPLALTSSKGVLAKIINDSLMVQKLARIISSL